MHTTPLLLELTVVVTAYFNVQVKQISSIIHKALFNSGLYCMREQEDAISVCLWMINRQQANCSSLEQRKQALDFMIL